MNAIRSICSLYRYRVLVPLEPTHTPKLNKEYEGSAKPLPLSKLINFRNVLCTQSPRKSFKCGNICVYTQHYTSLLLFDFVFSFLFNRDSSFFSRKLNSCLFRRNISKNGEKKCSSFCFKLYGEFLEQKSELQ